MARWLVGPRARSEGKTPGLLLLPPLARVLQGHTTPTDLPVPPLLSQNSSIKQPDSLSNYRFLPLGEYKALFTGLPQTLTSPLSKR